MADGIVIQDVVIAACEGICEAQSYWVRGDESNQSPRIGTPFRAWQ